jgi:hypothetical protein
MKRALSVSPVLFKTKKKAESGLTLVELLLVSILISVVFLGFTTAYVTAMKLLLALKAGESQLYGFAALERIVRTVNMGNQVKIGTAVDANDGTQLKVRWDYTLNTFLPNGNPAIGTTFNTADDNWVKFRFIGGRLRWRNDAAETPDVSGSDPEVQDGLIIASGSFFTLPNPIMATINMIIQKPNSTLNATLATDALAKQTSVFVASPQTTCGTDSGGGGSGGATRPRR